MKQRIVIKLKGAGKKAIALSVKLSGLGVIGFSKYHGDRKDKKMISVNEPEQSPMKAR